MVKFIHTADWQIGMKAAHVGNVGQQVRAERLESARRVVEIAIGHQAEFMIVAGDTFEDNAVDRTLVQKVADILGSFTGPVYIIPGNHDPLVPGCVWESPAWRSHSNLKLLTEATPLAIENVTLYPCPLFEKYSLNDPTQWIDARDDQKLAIGVAHGTVSNPGQPDLDYPIVRDAAARCGLDYLALGHWHSFSTFPSGDDVVRMAYSGTHETTRFGERDSGNALLVEIAKRGSPPVLTSLSTEGLVWEAWAETLVAEGDILRVRERIESLPAPDRTLIDLRIEGILHREDQVELERIEELIDARFLFGRMDSTGLTPNPLDENWFVALPSGVMHSVAQRLQTLSDASFSSGRPENASPAVATRALLELYRMVQEEKV